MVKREGWDKHEGVEGNKTTESERRAGTRDKRTAIPFR